MTTLGQSLTQPTRARERDGDSTLVLDRPVDRPPDHGIAYSSPAVESPEPETAADKTLISTGFLGSFTDAPPPVEELPPPPRRTVPEPDDTQPIAVPHIAYPPEPPRVDREKLTRALVLDDDLELRERKTRRLRVFTALGLAVVLVGGGIAVYEWWRASSGPAGQLTEPRLLTTDKRFAADPAIAPGGRFVAYASDRGDSNLAIWIQNLEGGEPSRVTGEQAHDSEPDVHPDGNHIVFRSERDGGGIYVVSLLSSEPPKLIAKNGRRPRYSPDGKYIAYYEKGGNGAVNGSRMFVVASEGGQPKGVQTEFPVAQFPAWLSDGRRLIFDGTNAAGVTDWWVTSMDGGSAVATGILPTVQQAFWSIAGPDSVSENRVYFSASAGEEKHVWSVGISPATWKMDSEPILITSGNEHYSEMRVLGKDLVAYSNQRTSMDIWVAPAAGDDGRVLGELRKISKEANYSHLAAVDGAGTRMVYLSNRSGVEDLWMTDLDGDSESPVTTDLRIAYRPVLSADGTRLIVSTVEGKKCSVVVADIEHRKEEVALEGCAGIWDWSPDRRHVVFFDPDGVGSRAAHLMQIPSGRRTELIWHPDFGIFNVRFSPDGKWVVFTAGPNISTGRIYVAPFRETVVAPEQWIPVSGTEASGPAWSPNGRMLYFRSARDGFDCIWAQRLDANKRASGEPFPVLHLHKPARGLFQLPESSFVLAVTKDRLVLTLARHTGEIWTARLKP